jgi:hypothetical protein
MLDREHTLELKLARAHGNGSGLRLEPEDVVALVQRLRERKPEKRLDHAAVFKPVGDGESHPNG